MIVDLEMFSTRKKKQQIRRPFSPLSERQAIFMVGQSNQNEQTKNRDNMLFRGTSLDYACNPAQNNYPQIDVNTLEENIASKGRREVDNLMTSVETRVQDAVLAAIEIFVIPRVELAIK